ncbi:MAG: hypothetical protein VX589_06320 [Myxococcota bacterium]|nr:hypothetical protein [Myxococcota bacterium]
MVYSHSIQVRSRVVFPDWVTLAITLLLSTTAGGQTQVNAPSASGPESKEGMAAMAERRHVLNLTRGLRFGAIHSALAQSPSDPAVIYLATSRGRVNVSVDGGQSWQESAALTSRGRFYGAIRSAGTMRGILDRWLTTRPISSNQLAGLNFAGRGGDAITGVGASDETMGLRVGGELAPRSEVAGELAGLESVNRSSVRGALSGLHRGLILPSSGGGGGGGAGRASSLAVGLKAKAPWLAYQVRRKRNWAIGITLQQSLVLKAGAGTWIAHLAVHPTNPNDVLAATEDGLLRSRDGGYSWPLILTGATRRERAVNFVIRHPDHVRVIYAATRSGLRRSKDDGETFQRMLHRHVAFSDVRWVSFDHEDPTTFYVGTTSGVVKTTDDGRSFKRIYRSPWPALRTTRQLEVDPHDRTRIWLGTADGLLVSRDAGKTFARAGGLLFTGQNIKRFAFGQAPGHLIVGTIRDLWETRDGGKTWQVAYFGPIQFDVRQLIADRSTPNSFLIGTTAEVLRFGPQAPSHATRADYLKFRARIAREPTIRDVLKTGLRRAGLYRPDLMSYRSGARLRGLMPRLIATGRWADYGADTVFNNVNISDAGDIFRNASTVPFMGTAFLSWDLAKMIFTSGETIGRRVGRMNRRGEDMLTRTIVALYQERMRLLFESMTQQTDARSRLLLNLRLEELTAHLNSLTGDLFTPIVAL